MGNMCMYQKTDFEHHKHSGWFKKKTYLWLVAKCITVNYNVFRQVLVIYVEVKLGIFTEGKESLSKSNKVHDLAHSLI